MGTCGCVAFVSLSSELRAGVVRRLTIDPSPAIAPPKFDPNVKDFTPPLEHCIRTHWEGAVRTCPPALPDNSSCVCLRNPHALKVVGVLGQEVDWNGTDPLL